ncbi:MAG: hypothetical protein CVU80_00155 [Elusimicrobia bacterium HGW-Elusimicrobia-4]|nr:MAG: hypothetical protein CVU80_00155 [Elusimicrobia bacterium HGW-Elusimicrobia-4]
MKKLLVLALVVGLIVPLVASDKKYATQGVVELGGTAGFSSISTKLDVEGAESVTTTTLSLAPEVGYFVADNISLGAVLNIASVNVEYADAYTTTGILLAPTYVFKGESAYPFVGLLLGLSSSKAGDYTENSTIYGLRGGVKVKLGGNGLLNLGLSYTAGSESDNDEPSNKYNLGIIRLNAGFSLYL